MEFLVHVSVRMFKQQLGKVSTRQVDPLQCLRYEETALVRRKLIIINQLSALLYETAKMKEAKQGSPEADDIDLEKAVIRKTIFPYTPSTQHCPLSI